jgi:hypothetical protein
MLSQSQISTGKVSIYLLHREMLTERETLSALIATSSAPLDMVGVAHGERTCFRTCNRTHAHIQTVRLLSSSSAVEENGMSTRLVIVKPGGAQSTLRLCTALLLVWKLICGKNIWTVFLKVNWPP